MAQHLAQKADAQMPQVLRPQALDVMPLGRLPEDGVDAVAQPAKQANPVRLRIAAPKKERDMQPDAVLGQFSSQRWRPLERFHPDWP